MNGLPNLSAPDERDELRAKIRVARERTEAAARALSEHRSREAQDLRTRLGDSSVRIAEMEREYGARIQEIEMLAAAEVDRIFREGQQELQRRRGVPTRPEERG